MPRPTLLILPAAALLTLLLAFVPAAPRPPRLGKVLGADISFLPQLEAKGMKFTDQGQQKDAIAIEPPKKVLLHSLPPLSSQQSRPIPQPSLAVFLPHPR